MKKKTHIKIDLLHFILENETSNFSCKPLLSVQYYTWEQQIKQKIPTKEAAAVDLTIHSPCDRQIYLFMLVDFAQRQI